MKRILLLFIIIFLASCGIIKPNPKYIKKFPKYYIVKKGDTLKKISQQFGISISKIKKFNNLPNDRIIIGQKLYFTPPKNTFIFYVTKKNIPKCGYYIVKKGDTLPIIAVRYGIPLQDLMDINELTDLKIKIGQKIFLRKIKRKKKETNIILKKNKNNKKLVDNDKVNFKRENYVLPLKGVITSTFGLRHGRMHKGIDIAAPIGTPIRSIADGKVVFSGIQNGYGNVIIISHKNNIMSVYAHNERNLVRVNDFVKKGQPIATVGKTGRATGPHLHFEFRVKGRAINPAKVFKF